MRQYVLICRPRRDETLSWRWCKVTETRDFAMTTPVLYHMELTATTAAPIYLFSLS